MDSSRDTTRFACRRFRGDGAAARDSLGASRLDKVSARVTLDDVKDMKPPTASTIVIPLRTKKSPNSPY